MDVLKLMCHSEPLPMQTDRVHVANGTYFLDGRYTYKKEFCLNRLKVAYNEDALKPERFLAFLNDLLYPEDIPTLQEYISSLYSCLSSWITIPFSSDAALAPEPRPAIFLGMHSPPAAAEPLSEDLLPLPLGSSVGGLCRLDHVTLCTVPQDLP